MKSPAPSFFQIWHIILNSSASFRWYFFGVLLFMSISKVGALGVSYWFAQALRLQEGSDVLFYGVWFVLFKLTEWACFVVQDQIVMRLRVSVVKVLAPRVFAGVLGLVGHTYERPVELLKKTDIRDPLRGFMGFGLNHQLALVLDLLIAGVLVLAIGGGSMLYALMVMLCSILGWATLGYYIYGYTKNKISPLEHFKSALEKEQRLADSSEDLFSKLFIAKAFGSVDFFIKTRKALAQEEVKALIRYRHQTIKSAALMFAFTSLMFVLLYSLSVSRYEAGLMDKGSFAALMMVALGVFWKLQKASYMFEDLVATQGALGYAFSFLNEQQKKEKENGGVTALVQDHDSTLNGVALSGAKSEKRKVQKEGVAGTVDEACCHENGLAFLGVNVFYEDHCVLKDVSFHLPKGGCLFVVGASGAGKSTLVKLLLQEVQKASGSILWGGIPLEEQKNRCSWVAQDIAWRGGSLDFNLRLGKMDATEDQMEQALKSAQLAQRLKVSDLGSPHIGAELSGGELQRFAIARALLSERPLMLLDEPTSALDIHTEKALLEEVLGTQGVTKLIVIHRVLAIPDHAHCLVLKDGAVCEYGLAEELKKLGGVFYTLCEESSYD